MISAAPAQTIVCVRIPASLNRNLRSKPIANPNTTAYTMRIRQINSSFNAKHLFFLSYFEQIRQKIFGARINGQQVIPAAKHRQTVCAPIIANALNLVNT